MDMPLNDPVTSTARAFEDRLATVGAKALTDFALWGGCVPGNTAELEPMKNLGARAFKAFMREVDGYPWCDTADLLEGMQEAARLGIPFGVHAESDNLVKADAKDDRERPQRRRRAHVGAQPAHRARGDQPGHPARARGGMQAPRDARLGGRRVARDRGIRSRRGRGADRLL